MARIDLGKVVGDSATIEVGSVTTLEAGQNATVENVGTSLNGIFNFGIPKGPKGDTGSQGPAGPQGVQGKPFTIDKTYSSVLDMEADFNNMEVGSYVMIASNVESEDNARLYYRDTNEWKFISDFSGATGIQGEQGPQGQAGYTPVKGVDYFTSADIAEIEGDIEEIIGDLQDLDTTDKTDIVSAINEVASNSGSVDTYMPYINTSGYSNYYLYLSGQQETLKTIINAALPNDKSLITSSQQLFVPTKNAWFTDGPLIKSLAISKSDNYYSVVINLTPLIVDQSAGTYLKYYNYYPYPSYTVFCSIGDDGNVTGVYSNQALTTQGQVRINLGGQTKLINANFAYDVLTTTNTTTYNPTPNSYNPATTKYVDDVVASVGGGADVYAISSKIVDLAGLKKGVYVFDKDILIGTSNVSFRCSYYATGANTKQYGVPLGMFVVLRDVTDDLENGTPLVTFYSITNGIQRIYNIFVDNVQSAGIDSTSLAGDELLLSNSYQTISGVKTFTALPQSSVVPTTDTQMANKKYVDDAIAAAITTTLGGGY